MAKPAFPIIATIFLTAVAVNGQQPVSPHMEGAVQCFASPTPGKRPAGMACAVLGTKTFRSLPDGDVTWRIETFPTEEAAQQAMTASGVVVEAAGKVWLLVLGLKGARTRGATLVAEIGPLPIPPAPSYEMIVLEADLQPRSNVLVHTHSGPEAWYLLSGKQCLDLPGRAVRANVGQGMFAPADTPMKLNIEAQRDAFFMVVHDRAKPWNTLSAWKPENHCGEQ